LTLAILLGRKKPTLAVFLVIVVILLMFVAPFAVKYFLDQTVRKVDVSLDEVAKLNYAEALIVKGHLKNSGKISYQKCHIEAKVFEINSNKYKNMLNNLKPFRNETILLEENISKGDEAVFKIVFEDFKNTHEYNVSLSGVCY
jgi:uncharacterized protein (UPF0333 family)